MTDKSAEEALSPTAHPSSDAPTEISDQLARAATGALFTVRGAGWIAGSVAAGSIPIFELPWLPPNYLMLICGVVFIAYFLSLPYLKNLYTVLLATAIAGAFWAWADVRANTLIFAVWGDRAGPWMQAHTTPFVTEYTYTYHSVLTFVPFRLHFFFGVGASLAPAGIAIVLDLCPPSSQLLVSGIVLALLSLATAILPTLLPPLSTTGHSKANEGNSAPSNTGTQLTRKILIVMLTSVFLFVYVGVESAYGGWLPTYTEEHFPDMSPSEAAALTSAFWIATTIGRLFAVPVLTVISHRTMLSVCLLSALPSGLALVLMPTLHATKYVLWVIAIYYGLTMAPVYASAFAMPTVLGFEVTHSTSSWIIVGSIGGDMAVPALMGLFITKHSASLPWAVLVAGITLLGLYGLFLMAKRWANIPRRNAEELAVLTKEPSSAPA